MHYNADCLFLSEYKFIKKRLSDILTSYKDDKLSFLKRALDSHSDAVDDVEIRFPKDSGKHVIEVTLEDGKTVGTIDFGDRTIRIITDGDIVLAKPSLKEKTKTIGEC